MLCPERFGEHWRVLWCWITLSNSFSEIVWRALYSIPLFEETRPGICWLTWRNRRLHTQPPPRLIRPRVRLSVHPSVRPSVRPSIRLWVHTCRLGIQRKIAQTHQIRSIILQNHESMWIVDQKFFEIITWNWRSSINQGNLHKVPPAHAQRVYLGGAG